MNIKNKTTINEDMLAEIFEGLEDCLENATDEPVAVMTENETFVIMTLEDFNFLQNKKQDELSEPYIKSFLETLEGLSAEELGHILTLANSQLNIKMAKEFFCRKEMD